MTSRSAPRIGVRGDDLARDVRAPCRKRRSRARALLQSVCIAATLALAGCSESRADDHFVVLLYHHVATDTPRITSVTPAEFESHLNYLEENDFNVWSLPRALSALDGAEPIPDRTVAITFDDAYTDIRTNAAPKLEARGWPYTVFVATKAVDQGHGGIMSWAELRDIQARGATLANHTHTHEHLIRRREGESEAEWLTRVREDIETAARRLEAETSTDYDLFAWPYGEYNRTLEKLAGESGLTVFTQASGAIGPGYDRQRLPRFPVAGDYAGLDTLENRLDALPLPVRDVEPMEPQRAADERRPVLSFTLSPGGFDPYALECFVSGQGRVTPELDGESPVTVRLRAQRPLPAGRSRYNCTAPAEGADRFYWYSHPWFIPNASGQWPDE